MKSRSGTHTSRTRKGGSKTDNRSENVSLSHHSIGGSDVARGMLQGRIPLGKRIFGKSAPQHKRAGSIKSGVTDASAATGRGRSIGSPLPELTPGKPRGVGSKQSPGAAAVAGSKPGHPSPGHPSPGHPSPGRPSPRGGRARGRGRGKPRPAPQQQPTPKPS